MTNRYDNGGPLPQGKHTAVNVAAPIGFDPQALCRFLESIDMLDRLKEAFEEATRALEKSRVELNRLENKPVVLPSLHEKECRRATKHYFDQHPSYFKPRA